MVYKEVLEPPYTKSINESVSDNQVTFATGLRVRGDAECDTAEGRLFLWARVISSVSSNVSARAEAGSAPRTSCLRLGHALGIHPLLGLAKTRRRSQLALWSFRLAVAAFPVAPRCFLIQ